MFKDCKGPRRALARFAGLMACLPLVAQAFVVDLQIDTTPLAGTVGYFGFDLVRGAAPTQNQVTISAFSTTGMLGSVTTSGNVLGALPAAVTLTSSTFLSEVLQGLTFGAGITNLRLTFSTNYVQNSIPDSFSLFLLDSKFAPFTTTDPLGANAFFAVDLLAPVVLQVYTSPSATVTVVPEPPAPAMAALGLAVLLIACRRGRTQSQGDRNDPTPELVLDGE